MNINIEFHFDFGSPNAYLSHRVIPAIEKRTGETFTYLPVLLGGVFKATNNVSPGVSLQGIKNKGEYQQLEIQRFVQKHAIEDFKMNPHFPVNTLQIMRGALVAQREDCFDRYIDEVYRHMWSQPKKMDDPQVIRAAFESSDLPADILFEGMQDPEIKQQLIENTQASVARGNFGSPTFFVEQEMFFGKDRVRQVEEQILAAKGSKE